jgi:hypothetical protein
VVCTDAAEHRRRVEARVARGTDVPGLTPPTWADVRARAYEAWDAAADGPRLVVDTSTRDPEACAAEVAAALVQAAPGGARPPVGARRASADEHALAACDWPPLPAPYAAALRDAVAAALARFDAGDGTGAVLGVVAAGTVVRAALGAGPPAHAASDLDVYVVHDAPFRQRVQARHAGVPCETFVNPPWAVRRYFADEHAEARPATAHMLATGHVVLARGPVVGELRAEAAAWLARPNVPAPAEVTALRYGAATLYEDATDLLDAGAPDAAAGLLLLGRAVDAMLQLRCRVAYGTVPRGKDLLTHVAEADPALGAAARVVFSGAPPAERRAAAEHCADLALGARGFFAWDSGPDPVPAPDGAD